MIVASDKEIDFKVLKTYKGQSRLERIASNVLSNYKSVRSDKSLVLTDDKAPVEIFTDLMFYQNGVNR